MSGSESGEPRKKSPEPLRTAEEARALAEATQRVLGTENYRVTQDGPVGREAIEKETILGHDNLEHRSEVEKEGDRDGGSPDGSFRSPK